MCGLIGAYRYTGRDKSKKPFAQKTQTFK